jgi:nitric oxide reductase NorD protein
MEERVGILWHRLINRLATQRFPEAAVELSGVSRDAALLFRALGGDHGITVQAGAQTRHGARTTMLERLAGSARKVDLAWLDHQALRLPPVVDVFPQSCLNRDLYFWLAALCAIDPQPELPWLVRNQAAALAVIRDFPGLAACYGRLVEAEIARRPAIGKLAADESQQELAIREALRRPGTVAALPAARRPPHPVLLWLRPEFPAAGKHLPDKSQDQSSLAASARQSDKKRRSAEYAEMPKRKGGLLLFRPESIFSWTEYARIEHESRENEDQNLAQAADDLDMIAIARDHRNIAKKLSMTLDLPAGETDDNPLNEGRMLPEWDYRIHTLKPDQCRVNMCPVANAEPCGLPEHLKRDQQRLRRQFGSLVPVRLRLKAQPEGGEIDIDAYLRHVAHSAGAETRFYQDQRKRERDLSCLLLADLSLSTEAWIGGERRVIDVIRDSLFLFSEALSVTRDRFALYGFSSKRRTDVRFHTLKEFNEPYGDAVRGRINHISPAYYTRMGAAIRYAAEILNRQKSRERLLLILTDGKPNDADHYEGRYGIEDTRKALVAARQQGLRPFCVTVDQEAHEYLPHIFGKDNFIIIRKPSELPARLPLLYALLTR